MIQMHSINDLIIANQLVKDASIGNAVALQLVELSQVVDARAVCLNFWYVIQAESHQV